jgi:hypothetical protein
MRNAVGSFLQTTTMAIQLRELADTGATDGADRAAVELAPYGAQ